MKLYVKIVQRVPHFNLSIFRNPGKGRIAINYSSQKLKKFSTRNHQFQTDTKDSTIAVNMYKWFLTREPSSFVGVLSYSNGGLSYTLVIKNRSAVEHFLRDWL